MSPTDSFSRPHGDTLRPKFVLGEEVDADTNNQGRNIKYFFDFKNRYANKSLCKKKLWEEIIIFIYAEKNIAFYRKRSFDPLENYLSYLLKSDNQSSQ